MIKKKQLASNSFVKSFCLVFLGTFGYWAFNQVISNLDSISKNDVKIKYANKHLDHLNQKKQNLDQSFSGKAYAIDGDSLKVAGNNVRLFGIDAPEYSQKCLNADNIEYDCGIIAKKYTSDLVRNKEVMCYYRIKDFYNRYLSKCYINGLEINKELLKNGMAIIYSYQETDGEAKALEKEAREAKIGIWQGAFENPKDYRSSHKRHSK